jgi:hypothetical protein
VAYFPTIRTIAIYVKLERSPLAAIVAAGRQESVHQSIPRSPLNIVFTMLGECGVVNEWLAGMGGLYGLWYLMP